VSPSGAGGHGGVQPTAAGAARPSSRRPRLAALLPSTPTRFAGPTATWWFAAAYLTTLTVRSLIHLLAFDGGAGTIATMDVTVEGGANLVALFGQWGAIQLLLCLLLWVLLLRYRGFVPLVLLVFLVEPALRAASGHLKPIETLGSAPGAVLNAWVAPVLAVMLWWSLCPALGRRTTGTPR
jgi:hypothetical protein